MFLSIQKTHNNFKNAKVISFGAGCLLIRVSTDVVSTLECTEVLDKYFQWILMAKMTAIISNMLMC